VPVGPIGPTGPYAPFDFGTPGPWPVENVRYGQADGILETPVTAMTTDEGQNRWVATHWALYMRRPGATSFRRIDERDGLHLGVITGNAPGAGPGWAKYCRMRPVADDAPCDPADTRWGGAGIGGILSLAGGKPGEVFVGYHGVHTEGISCGESGTPEAEYDDCDPLRHMGKIDRVRVAEDGSVTVDRFDLLSNAHGAKYWHNRIMYRLVYDHFVNRGTLYSAAEHGITILFPDRFRLPRAGEWFDLAYGEWMGDHLHARVCFEKPCSDPTASQRMGDWFGLALDARGWLWHAGKWSAGLITWVDDPHLWFSRNGAAFDEAFGDGWPAPGSLEPVFRVAAAGHPVHLSSVAVCPDGKVWFGSLGPEDGVEQTIASFDRRGFTTYLASAAGLPERSVRDLVCLPDGRLVIAGPSSGLAVWNPATGRSERLTAATGHLPSDRVLKLELDVMADPPSLHVATAGGAAVIRVFP
jgi:hypothetical protein